jgi:ABC-type transport system involved in Fe-S cluster assembly fused permease/ATPase subunit
MDRITEMIQAGIKRVSVHSFDHLHDLDLTYHKAGSKNTVFGINRALKSLDQGLRFFLGLFAQMGMEFFLLCIAL